MIPDVEMGTSTFPMFEPQDFAKDECVKGRVLGRVKMDQQEGHTGKRLENPARSRGERIGRLKVAGGSWDRGIQGTKKRDLETKAIVFKSYLKSLIYIIQFAVLKNAEAAWFCIASTARDGGLRFWCCLCSWLCDL